MITRKRFDPGRKECKTPYGAVPSGSTIHLSCYPLRREAFCRVTLTAVWEAEEGRQEEREFSWTDMSEGIERFSAVFSVGDYVGLIFYTLHFFRTDGREVQEGPFQLTVYAPENVPSWFGKGISYQIFPDRFARLTVPDATGMIDGRRVHRDWFEEPEWKPDGKGEVRNRDFFGGSLAGIADKLDYIASLGVENIYLCPIFEAAENHRYGTADYEKIDPMLGTDAEFSEFCRRVHAKGMRVILDGVFNHVGFISRYFNSAGFYPEKGAYESLASPYSSWFRFDSWPDRYDSWWGIYSLPTTDKNSKEWLSYITGENGIIRRWLRAGADGWRLDVADELPDFVVEAIHRAARAEKSDAVIIGEVWEDASSKIAYDVRRRHILGYHCDGVMNYPLRSAMLDFAREGDGMKFRDTVEALRQNYPHFAFYSGMNFLGSHDTPRILTLLGTGTDRAEQTKEERSLYRMTPEEKERGQGKLKLISLLLYALPGSPTLYYGDEAGVEGYEDPFNRRTFPWGNEDRGLLAWFRTLGQIRKNNAPLREGDFSWGSCEGHTVSFLRTEGEESVLACANEGKTPAVFTLPGSETSVCLKGQTAALFSWNGERVTTLVNSEFDFLR